MEVLICERCGKIYPIEHSGILCDCGGKLIPVNIDFTLTEGNGGHPDSDEESIAS